MTFRELYVGPRYPELESAAFDRISTTISDQPRSLLYVARTGHAERQTRRRWQEVGDPLSLSVETFDSIVGECYEKDQFAGEDAHIDRPLRNRIVELAVERLENQSNPLAVPSRTPSAGLCEHVEDLLSLMEFADLHSPTEFEERLAEEGLPSQARTVRAVKTAFEDVRSSLTSTDDETLLSERYDHVLSCETALSNSLPQVDGVILGGFTLFSPLERRLVELLAETWPTVALHPQVTDSIESRGVDRGAERGLGVYRELGFAREYLANDAATLLGPVREMYRPQRTGPGHSRDDVGGSITLCQPETLPHEVRYVARNIRERIANGTTPDGIGVVLTAPADYHERLDETLDQYQIPSTSVIDRAFDDTALGEVISELITLSQDDPPIDSLIALFANPLVTRLDEDTPTDETAVGRLADRLTSRRLETAFDHLDAEVSTGIQTLLDDTAALRKTTLRAFPDEIEAIVDRLGVRAAIEGLPKIPRGQTERTAVERLERVLETLARTDGVADRERADPVARLERAFSNVTIDAESGREDGTILVCELKEAAPREFEHVYVLGLTEGRFPSNPDRLAFTRPINEAHVDFQRTDIRQRARYDFGLLLASEASLTLSVPERDLGGTPYVEADVVSELRRVTGLVPEAISNDERSPGSREDVQRSLTRAFAHDETDDYASLIDRATESEAFDDTHSARLQRGTACASARAGSTLTPYDGRLSAETVDLLHGQDAREPYSPSQLETYAKCGFKYYVDRILDIDEPDEIELEPDALERGGFVHHVLQYYYVELQENSGTPVDIVGDRDEREARLLEIALSHNEDRFEDEQTAFHRSWLVELLAGLGNSDDNPYFGEDTYGAPERGMFVRFLDHEFDEVAKATARPTWFEARVGDPYEGETAIRETPVRVTASGRSVSIAGMIDRVDTVPGTSPTHLVVRDYKTGSTPSENDTLGGLAFQLPLYALISEDVFDGVETVGGAYYQVRPPNSVNHRRGLVGSREHATHHRTDEVTTPLLRHGKPAFETHDEFRKFVEGEIGDRLGRLATAIEDGAYHPTILDPNQAGCRYCGYSDVCDVRPHRRREVIDVIDDGDVTAYVPLSARDEEPTELLEVE